MRLQHRDDLRMLLLRDLAGYEDAEVADVLVHQPDDHLPARLDLLGAAIHIGDPVERLLRRRDVVAYRGEQNDRHLDLPQVESAARPGVHAARPDLVADEEILRDPLDLLAVHQEVAAPPALELEEARRLGVDVGEQVVILVPERVGRVQVLEVLHQRGAVELARADIGGERREPRAAQQPAGVAHRIVAFAFAPGAAPVRHRGTDDHDRTGVVRARRSQHHGRPACLAVANDRRLRRAGMERANVVNELALGVAHVEQRLPGFGIREEDDEVHRMPFAQRYTHLGVVLEAADAGPVTAARVDDHVGPALGINAHAFRRHDSQQCVVDRTLERAPVHDHFVVEVQNRRQPVALVLDEVVPALAQRIQEQDGALREIDCVLAGACRKLPGEQRIRRRSGSLRITGLSDPLAEVLECQPRACLQHLRDLRRDVVGVGKLPTRIAHGLYLSS